MTEVMADPPAVEGQPSTSPEPTEPTPELGAGFMDAGSSDDGPAAAEGQSPEARSSTGVPMPENDNPPAQTEEQREGTLRWDDWTRKTQDIGDERRLLADEKATFRQEREQWITDREQRLVEQAPSDGQASRADQFEQAAQMSDDPDQRRGLVYMADQERTITELKSQVGTLMERFEEINPRVEATERAANELTEEQNQALQKQIVDETQIAKGAFGVEAVAAARNFILRNLNTLNDKTGEVFSVSELVAMHSGKPLQETLQAVEKQREARATAKRQASSTTQTHGESAGNGFISRAEAVEQIRNGGG